jgi:hypothetical protein
MVLLVSTNCNALQRGTISKKKTMPSIWNRYILGINVRFQVT